MAWTVLLLSGVCEAVWAHALDHGLGAAAGIAAFALSLTASMGGLRIALRSIPLGTAYAVWAGTGTAATAVWSMFMGTAFSPAKLAFLALLVVGIAGLQLTTGELSGPAHRRRSGRGR